MSLTINQLAYELLINALEHDLVLDCDDDLFDSLCDDNYDELKTVEMAMTELFEQYPEQTSRALRFLAAGALLELHVYLMPLIDAILDRRSQRCYTAKTGLCSLCPAA